MTLKIGSYTLSSNVLLAPMSGVSDVPFRRLVSRMGAGLVFSEMIASQAMVRKTKQSMKMAESACDNMPLAVQLAGCCPDTMAEAAKLNEDLGAKIIDINMGCPVKKVAIKSYAGSALMKDEALAAKIIEATVKAVNLPVTLKMRTGWNDQNRNAPKLAKIAEDAGIQMITVHGRTRCQLYNGKADWKFINQVKQSINIPVIGNGDVKSEEDAKNLLKDSGADGVMVGRGTYGKPWMTHFIDHYLKNGTKKERPDLDFIKETMLEHFEDMLSYYGEITAIRLARKHVAWYTKGCYKSTDFRNAVNTMDNAAAIRSKIDEFFNETYFVQQELEN